MLAVGKGTAVGDQERSNHKQGQLQTKTRTQTAQEKAQEKAMKRVAPPHCVPSPTTTTTIIVDYHPATGGRVGGRARTRETGNPSRLPPILPSVRTCSHTSFPRPQLYTPTTIFTSVPSDEKGTQPLFTTHFPGTVSPNTLPHLYISAKRFSFLFRTKLTAYPNRPINENAGE